MGEVCRKVPAERGELDTPPANRAIATLAGAQHGVVSRAQLRAAGLTDTAIDRRVASGALHRMQRGVYTVGHTVLGTHGYWMAAVLTCGPGAVLSHAAAAALWGIRPSAAERTDVTVPGTAGRKGTRVRIHRSRALPPSEVTTRRGIPVTTVARTVLDMATRLSESHLENLLNEVERRELTDYPALEALARAHTGHRGAGKLRQTLHTHEAGTKLTKSDLEVLFRQLCKDHGLPEPWVNHTIQGKEVDFLFVEQRLIVEADSWAYHKTRRSFESDRARDVTTAQAGYRTLRFTDRQLTKDPVEVATAVHALLSRSSASRSSGSD